MRDSLVSLNDEEGILASGLVEANLVSNGGANGIDRSPSGLAHGNTCLDDGGIGLRLRAGVGHQGNVAVDNTGGQILGGIAMGNHVP